MTIWAKGKALLDSTVLISIPGRRATAHCDAHDQSIHDMITSLCMQVHNMTIRAKGKALLESTVLTITQGRRYGLVGPNGKGKSTLLRMIARRQIPVPDSLDVLLVEQVHCHRTCTPVQAPGSRGLDSCSWMTSILLLCYIVVAAEYLALTSFANHVTRHPPMHANPS